MHCIHGCSESKKNVMPMMPLMEKTLLNYRVLSHLEESTSPLMPDNLNFIYRLITDPSDSCKPSKNEKNRERMCKKEGT